MREGRRQTRRSVLATLAGATVLAGCSEQSPGGTPTQGENGGSPTPTTAAPEAVSCTSLTDGYERYDAGETPLVLDFEYPVVFADRVTYREPSVVRGSRPATDPDRRLSFGVEQGVPSDGAPDRDAVRDAGWRGAFRMRVDDEQQQVYGRGSGATARTGSAERLCHLLIDRGGDERYARIRAAVRIGPEERGVDEECARALDRAADQIFRSATLNEDSTALF